MTSDNKLKKKPGLVEYEVDDELAVYDPDLNKVHILNRTASAVWGLIEEGTPTEEIVSLMAKAYGLDLASAKKDVMEVIRRFSDAGLVLST